MLVNRCYQTLNSMDVNGKSPLDHAFQNKHTPIIDYEKHMTVTLYAEKNRNTE